MYLLFVCGCVLDQSEMLNFFQLLYKILSVEFSITIFSSSIIIPLQVDISFNLSYLMYIIMLMSVSYGLIIYGRMLLNILLWYRYYRHHGTYIRWYLINSCACKKQSLLFDLVKAFAQIESNHKSESYFPSCFRNIF